MTKPYPTVTLTSPPFQITPDMLGKPRYDPVAHRNIHPVTVNLTEANLRACLATPQHINATLWSLNNHPTLARDDLLSITCLGQAEPSVFVKVGQEMECFYCAWCVDGELILPSMSNQEFAVLIRDTEQPIMPYLLAAFGDKVKENAMFLVRHGAMLPSEPSEFVTINSLSLWGTELVDAKDALPTAQAVA
ncbi:MAG: hypothetical protein WAX89_00375 [Alphaproteobacteria bacterium]